MMLFSLQARFALCAVTGLLLLGMALPAAEPAPAAPAAPATATPHGYDYFQLRDGLQTCAARFTVLKTGRVAFLGGSITEMHGWRELVQADLAARFPATRFDFVSAGISSLGSTPHAFRFSRDVLARGPVDLLFVEAAVNDAGNGMTPVEMVRGMEGVVRQARLDNPGIDVVMMHFAEPSSIKEIAAGATPVVIANHERVAERYRIPSLDLAREVAERIAAKEFTWEKDFRDLHPAPFGHAVYARAIARLCDAAWRSPPVQGAETAVHALPEPLDEFSYVHGRLLPLTQATGLKGWQLDPKWRPTDGAGVRARFVDVPFLVADTAGSSLTLPFSGRGVGVFLAAGPDCGMITYSVDGGPPRTVDGYSRWSGGLHLPWVVMLATELPPGEHTLELSVAATANPASKGHALRIAHFLAN